MFDYENPAYKAWKSIGPKLTASNPKGLVIVSAHWENPENTEDVKVNSDTSNPLIYDFYNFPKHFYAETFKSAGSSEIVREIKAAVGSAGIGIREDKRGLDHGVWVPLKVAFDGKTDIPLVQVSLPGDGSPVSAAKLGKALSGLRDNGYTIIGTGQVVHNLRDFFGGRPTPYAAPFLEAVTNAVAAHKTLESTLTLFRHPLYKNAHPTPEHLLPLVVSVAATRQEDELEKIYVSDQAGLGWGMWRWK